MYTLRKAILILTLATALIIHQEALAQDPDKTGDQEERTAPTQPGNLRLYEATTHSGDLRLAFTPGLGATIHEIQLLRSGTETGPFTDQGEPITPDSSPADLGNHGLDHWYQAKARACDDDDDCSSYVFSSKLYLPVPEPPRITITLAAVNPAANTATVRWHIASHPRTDTYSVQVQVSETSAFLEDDILHQKDPTGKDPIRETVIQDAWATLGTGTKHVRARTCNTKGQCLTATGTLTLQDYNRDLKPAPIPLGGTSETWRTTAPADRVFLNVQAAGTPEGGNIRIEGVDPQGYPLRSQNANQPSDSGDIPWSGSFRDIRVKADPDAFSSEADTVTITFHWGDSSRGPTLATATVRRQTKPAEPQAAATPHHEDTETLATTLDWTEGTHPTGSSPDHYEVEISTGTGRVYRNADVSATSLEIPRNLLDEGRHQAEVRHCNAAGGCSEALTITFTPSADNNPRVRMTGLEEELPRNAWDTFTITADRLTAGAAYSLTLSVPAGSGMGFDQQCTDQEDTLEFTPTGTSHSVQDHVRTCQGPGGDVTATLRETGATAALDTYASSVETKSPGYLPDGFGSHRPEVGTDDFTILFYNLPSGREYSVMLLSNSPSVGLGTPCADHQRQFFAVPPGVERHHVSATLHRCAPVRGNVVMVLLETAIDPADPVVPKNTPTPISDRLGRDPLISTGTLFDRNEITVGEPERLEIHSYNLARGQSYVISLATGSANAGFNQDCSSQDHSIDVTEENFSYNLITLHACQAGSVDLDIQLKQGGVTVAAMDLDLTVVNPTAAGAPTDLDVTPLPEREAMISWTAPTGAAPGTEYTVEWAVGTGSPDADWESLGTTDGTELAIKLYPQLVEHDSFAVRVRAGEPSEAVIIVDSPITRADGDSRSVDHPVTNTGQVEIRWDPIAGASNFRARIRELEAEYHYDTKTLRWDYTENSHPSASTAQLTNIESPHHILPLRNDKVIAIQLVYEKDGTTVYSGQDTYALTSTKSETGKRIANLPLKKISREYPYRVCQDSFKPFARQWTDLADAALDEWDGATNNLVSTTPLRHEDCADFTRFITEIEQLLRAELDPELEDPATEIRNLLEALYTTGAFDKVLQKDYSKNDIRGLSLQNPANVFLYEQGMTNIAEVFYHHARNFNDLMRGGSGTGYTSSDYETRGRDIFIGMEGSEAYEPTFPSTVRFGTCKPHSYNYGLMVHEAGHVWGIRRHGQIAKPGEDIDHPHNTLEIDSVMNYGTIEGGTPDDPMPIGSCSPSQLDVMAIYAMFQTEQAKN